MAPQALKDRISFNFLESRRVCWPFVRQWLQKGHGQLLVAGCGDGRNVAAALQQGYEAIYAVDLSQGMLRAARRRLGETAGAEVNSR